MDKEEEKAEFTVTDKRLFRENGEKTAEVKEPPAAPTEKTGAQKETVTSDSGQGILEGSETSEGKIPQIDFPSYILSYYTQGLVLLGEVPNPMTGKKEEDTEGARHTIDILTLLQEKTKGNLKPEEDQLIGTVLYELRMKFMSKTSRIKV